MSIFDIIVNFIEAFIYILFIFLIIGKKSLFSFILTIFAYTINLSIFNYFLLPEVFLSVTNFLILLSYSEFLNKKNLIQNTFISLIPKIFNTIAFTSALIFTSCFYAFPSYEGNGYICLVIVSKLLFFIIVLLSSFYIRKYHLLETKKLKYLLLSIFILNLAYSSIADFIFYNGILDQYIKSLLIFINLLSLCLFVIFIETQKEQKHLLALQKDNLRLETQEQIQKINNENIQELNKWKHDMSHVLNVIQFKLNHQQMNEANEIINQMTNRLSEYQIIMKTGNDLLDHLLIQKYELLKEKDIKLLTSYNSCYCPLEDTHFCILLGNLLNNAIENCTGENKFIYLLIEQKAHYYHIEIRNTIHKSILKENPYLLTHKEDKHKHGIGLKSIQFIVNQYNGKISFHDTDKEFIVNIIMPNN